MKTANNEKGVALVTALMLMLVMLAMCMTLLYIVTQSTKSSASQKRYSTATAASYGGTEVLKAILPRLMNYSSLPTAIASITGYSNIDLAFAAAGSDRDCLSQKLKLDRKDWTACSADNTSEDALTKPDVSFTLHGLTPAQNYKVYSKIVNTVNGNTDTSGGDLQLERSEAVNRMGGGIISPPHYPYYFNIEVSGQKEFNSQERAALSVLYVY